MVTVQKIKDVLGQVVFGIDPGRKEIESSDTSSYEQDSIGAPVEKDSPLGYQISSWTIVYLIIQGVIGTGIFVTPSTILKSMGSIGASYVLWIVGYIITMFSVCVYIEFVTYFPKRSGAEVAYLEQSYPRPRLMVPVVYAATTVILSFATSSASAFASYIYSAAGYSATAWEKRALGILPLVLCFAIVSLNNKFAIRLSNFIGFVKVIFVLFMALTVFPVLSGNTRLGNNNSVFDNSWEGTTTDGNSISNAILKVVFSYGGSSYAFGVVAETVPKNTIRAYKFYVPITMFLLLIIYILINTALFAGLGSVEAAKSAGDLISSIYFENLFGKRAGSALSAFVAISAFGHLLTVFIAHSRSLRECGRQGVLPYPRLWSSVKPFGTPIFPAFVTLVVNIIVLIAPPPGDAYNFIVDLGSYSSYIFNMILFVGLFRLRKIRKRAGLGYKQFHIWTPVLILATLWTFFVLAMSFVPPKGTLKGSDVSFFYATYPLTTIGIVIVCFLYYAVWAFILPRFGNYQHRIETFELATGEKGHTVIKVPLDQLDEYDATHDPIESGKINVIPGSEAIDSLSTSEGESGEITKSKSDGVVISETRI